MKAHPQFSLLLLGTLLVSCAIPPVDGISIHVDSTATVLPSETPIPVATPTQTPEPRELITHAEALLMQGDPDTARLEYQNALDTSLDIDQQAAALLGIGRTYYEKGDCDSAIQIFNDLLSRYPQNNPRINAYYFMGECYLSNNKPLEAATAFGEFLHYNPGILDAHVQELRGDALSEAGVFLDAAAAYDAASQAPQLDDPLYQQVKAAQAFADAGDPANAIRRALAVYDTTQNEYLKAQVNLLAGRSYAAMGEPEQAYARYLDSVNNYPRSYDSYLALIELLQADQPVDDLNRGLVDYFASQYGQAVEAFNRYMGNHQGYDGTPLHYKALSLLEMGDVEGAVAAWNTLIAEHPEDRFFAEAHSEKAFALWAYVDQYQQAALVLLDFVQTRPSAPEAAGFLYEAARIQERGDMLEEASLTWERVMSEYPASDYSSLGLFMAGIVNYRLERYEQALVLFQRLLVLAVDAEEQSSAGFWIGKCLQSAGRAGEARDAFQQAAQRDPTGYYSERANEVLQGIPPLTSSGPYDLSINWDEERHLAELWMRTTFSLADDVNLQDLGPLSMDQRFRRGLKYLELSQYSLASLEFESLRQDLQQDAVNSFRLLPTLLEKGLFRTAIYTSRQILDLAGLDDAATLNAPSYFNSIRFGSYYRDSVMEAAEEEGFEPFLLYSVIRQESLFESHIQSSAGARGLMQILPATGSEIAGQIGWPPGYSVEDLYNPVVNIRFGAHYLANQRSYFGDIYSALSAYNGGPGNTSIWAGLSKNDPDLLLEVIRPQETRLYIRQIAEFTHIYRTLYGIQSQ